MYLEKVIIYMENKLFVRVLEHRFYFLQFFDLNLIEKIVNEPDM